MLEGVTEITRMIGHGAGAGHVDRRRSILRKSFVRADLVVDLLKGMEGLLLADETGLRRRSSIVFEGEMEALMTPVLLRRAWGDALWEDAEGDPPGRETAKAGQTDRGERRAIVGTDRAGQAELAESIEEDGTDVLAIGFWDRMAADEVTGVGIGDGEWVAALAIAAEEPTLEVGTPDIVGLTGMSEGLVVFGVAGTFAPCVAKAFAAEDFANGAGCGPGEIGFLSFQHHQ
jgi:hypothetical protein